jgi:hypothetical protein
MPRRHAIRICCAIITKFSWKPVGGGLLDTHDWFGYYNA